MPSVCPHPRALPCKFRRPTDVQSGFFILLPYDMCSLYKYKLWSFVGICWDDAWLLSGIVASQHRNVKSHKTSDELVFCFLGVCMVLLYKTVC